MHECPEKLSGDLLDPIVEFACRWASAPTRPSPPSLVREAWDELLSEWVASGLPLFVRRSTLSRGKIITHETGRALVPCDNTPAHWALQIAIEGKVPSLSDIRDSIRQIPIAMVLKKEEKAVADFGVVGRKGGPNSLGWKVCHIEPVKLGRGDLRTRDLNDIENHFLRFMAPSNMFLIPQERRESRC